MRVIGRDEFDGFNFFRGICVSDKRNCRTDSECPHLGGVSIAAFFTDFYHPFQHGKIHEKHRFVPGNKHMDATWSISPSLSLSVAGVLIYSVCEAF